MGPKRRLFVASMRPRPRFVAGGIVLGRSGADVARARLCSSGNRPPAPPLGVARQDAVDGLGHQDIGDTRNRTITASWAVVASRVSRHLARYGSSRRLIVASMRLRPRFVAARILAGGRMTI